MNTGKAIEELRKRRNWLVYVLVGEDCQDEIEALNFAIAVLKHLEQSEANKYKAEGSENDA